MNDKQNHDNPRPKKPYQKPELIQVPLRPEEAVLGACKGTSAGPGGGFCNPSTCKATGS
jgi:hypothetical protein